MPNPRRAWRRAWQVDLPAGVAVHESTGARVRYVQAGAADPSGSKNHLGVQVQVDNQAELLATLSAQHGPAAAQQMLQRLAREAAELHDVVSRRLAREAGGHHLPGRST